MKIITSKTHAYLDYAVLALTITAPWVFSISNTPAIAVLFASAIVSLGYNLLTNYELGIAAQISMNKHLAIDIASGLLLAFAPWILHFSDTVFVPHLVLGLLKAATAGFTRISHARNTLYISYKRYEKPYKMAKSFQYQKNLNY